MTRTDVLNRLALGYKLNSFLEIGVQNPMQNFDKIMCPVKFSVDPDPNAHASYRMTSDDYFRVALGQEKPKKYDLIFIDGLHEADQVARDCINAMKMLSPGGFLVFHDCNPENEEYTHVPRDSKVWNGDVYRFAAVLDVPKFTVDVDHGCMVVPWAYMARFKPFTIDNWDQFWPKRKELLNLISWDEFCRIF